MLGGRLVAHPVVRLPEEERVALVKARLELLGAQKVRERAVVRALWGLGKDDARELGHGPRHVGKGEAPRAEQVHRRGCAASVIARGGIIRVPSPGFSSAARSKYSYTLKAFWICALVP